MQSTTQPAPRLLVIGVLVIGVLGISSAAIFIRLAIAAAGTPGVPFSLFIAATRMLLAAMLLLPLWSARGGTAPRRNVGALKFAIAAGVCLALHFAAWISSLSFTSIAASTTLVTTNPIWVALVSGLVYAQRPRKATILGIGVAMGGSVAIALTGNQRLSWGGHPLLGNSLALLGAWCATAYVLLGREAQQRGLPIGRYAAIAYSTAALVLFPLPLLNGIQYTDYGLDVYLPIIAMAVLSQLVGHTSVNWSVTQISPTLVTLCILLEPVGSTLLGAMIFGEVPSLQTGLGAILVLFGVAIATLDAATRPDES